MSSRRINISIAGRNYPLNVPSIDEEILRKVGKQIDGMIKEFEANYTVNDKQDALAMCALRLGMDARIKELNNEKIIKTSNEKLLYLNSLLDKELKEL